MRITLGTREKEEFSFSGGLQPRECEPGSHLTLWAGEPTWGDANAEVSETRSTTREYVSGQSWEFKLCTPVNSSLV